ncbi:hypothetical protein [Qipengyuania sp. RANM35]|uniref:hypothetical protein n=1 Tax=Qipengyuania sp. RANM35 TaxID=3068635 RepID=UPI0034DB4757
MKWAFSIFLGLYLIALFLLAVGTFGWFGQEKDPLSGVFLLPLGLPWNLVADKLGFGGWLTAVAAPAINAAVLWFLWKR